MASKPQKSWSEIQLAITVIALTITIGFWNFFSAGQKPPSNNTPTAEPPTEDTTTAQAPEPTPQAAFLPVKIIFGGQAPQQRTVVVQAPSTSKTTKHRNPVTVSTGSSK